MEKMEQIYNQLNEENKQVITMVAKGIQVGQQNANNENKQK